MRTLILILTVSLLCGATLVAAAEVEPNAEATEAYNAYVEAYKADNMAEAEKQLKAAQAAQADWAKPYVELGQLYVQQKKYGPAAQALATATELDPTDAHGFLFLGNAYVAQELYSKAFPALNQALTLDSSLVEAHKLLATAYFEEGDYTAARTHYQAYTAVETGDALALLRLAETEKKLRKNSSAVRSYRAAIKADPKLFAARYNLGNLYLETQDFADAEEQFAAAMKIEPRNFRAQFNLAIAIHSQGRLEDALAAYQQVVKIGGNKSAAKSTVSQAQKTIKGLEEQIAAGEN
jgi:superkiller protein 3